MKKPEKRFCDVGFPFARYGVEHVIEVVKDKPVIIVGARDESSVAVNLVPTLPIFGHLPLPEGGFNVALIARFDKAVSRLNFVG